VGYNRDGAYLLSLRVGTLVVSAASGIMVARVLGPEGKGVVHMVILLPQFVASLGSFGLRASSTYFCGRGRSTRSVLRIVYGMAALLGGTYLAIGLLGLEPLRATILQGIETRWIILGLCLIPVYLFWFFADSVLHGTFRFGRHTAYQFLSLGLRIGLLLVLLLILDRGVPGAVFAYAAAAAIPALLTVVSAWTGAKPGGEPVTRGEMLRYGLQVHWGNLAQRANLSLDSFLINPFVGPAGVGLYSVAVMLAQLSWLAPGAMSEVLFPRVAAGKHDDTAQLSAFLGRTALLLATVPALGLALLGRPLIGLVYGAEYLPATTALWALLPGVIALSLGMVLSQYLAGIGRPVYNSIGSVIALAVNLAALFTLVPRYGIVGAGIATSMAYIIQAGLVTVFFLRLTDLTLRDLLIPNRSDLRNWREAASQAWRRVRRKGAMA